MNTMPDLLDLTWDWILSSTVRASLLAVAVLLLRGILHRHLPARWRHALWLPVVAVLLLPLLPARPAWMTLAVRSSSIAPPQAVANVAAGEVAGTVAPMATDPSEPANLHGLPVLWAAGALLVLGVGITMHTRNLKRISRCSRPASAELVQAVHAASAAAGLTTAPRLLVSSAVEGPAVTGLFRPTLLLPANFPNGFSGDEARLVLLHECVHVKRFDLPLNGLVCLLQAVHWFNPILWFAFSRLRADREAACDSAVLSLSPADHRSDYGHALLKLQAANSSTSLQLGLVGAFNSRRDLAIRIRDISAHGRHRAGGSMLGAFLLAVLAVAGMTRAAEKSPALQHEDPPEEKAAKAAEPAQAPLEAKIERIVFPELSFREVTLAEVVNFLRVRSKELDPDKNVASNGVNFVLSHRRMPDGTMLDPGKIPITFQQKNVTLKQALEGIARGANLTMTVDAMAVTLAPAGFAKPPMPTIVVKPRTLDHLPGKAAKAAGKIVIPSLSFDNLTLAEAVALLNTEAKKHAGTIKPPLVTLHPKSNAAMRMKELKLRNVPLDVALIYLGDLTRSNILADDKELRLVPGNLRNP